MMISSQKYFDTIVLCLQKNPYQNTKKIGSALEKEHGTKLSQAQVYNILKRMIQGGILVKEKGVLSLSIQWLQQLERFVQQAYLTHSDQLELEVGDHRVYKAQSFRELDTLWSDLSSKLVSRADQDIYYYDPHPYHILSRMHQEVFDLNKFTEQGNKIVYRIGSETYLDEYGRDLLVQAGYTVELYSSSTRAFYASVGDYWYVVDLAEHIYEYFEMFFVHTESIDQLQRELFDKTFAIKGLCTLTVYRDPEKAHELAQRILQKKI